MNCGLIYLIVGMLCLWPLGVSAGQSPTPAEIQQVQARLKAVGLDPGPLDGTWGPQTEAALRIYQQQRGLPVSGQLDNATRQTLLSTSGAPEAVQEAQTPRAVPQERPEQQRSAHDRSEVFQATQALPSSPAFVDQPDEGKALGFEFARDPLNAKRPMQTFDETMQTDVQAKPGVTAAQQQLLERRYELTPRSDPEHRMSRGKPLPVGPTARLAPGRTWESLAQMTPEAIR
jgi:Putative peptidoglycan binding domain